MFRPSILGFYWENKHWPETYFKIDKYFDSSKLLTCTVKCLCEPNAIIYRKRGMCLLSGRCWRWWNAFASTTVATVALHLLNIKERCGDAFVSWNRVRIYPESLEGNSHDTWLYATKITERRFPFNGYSSLCKAKTFNWNSVLYL